MKFISLGMSDKAWILIGTWIYSLWLQPWQITITYNHSFFDSFHQQCTGTSRSSSEANRTEFSSWSNSDSSWTLLDLLSLWARPQLPSDWISFWTVGSQVAQSSKVTQGWHSTAASEHLLICHSPGCQATAVPKLSNFRVTQSLVGMQLPSHYCRNLFS
jgi:hypothetical protein